MLSQWNLGGSQVIHVVAAAAAVVVVAASLCHIRRRRCLDVDGGARCSPPVYVSFSSKASPDSCRVDSWLQTVMEWAWSRSHVTWRHLAHCGVDAWMTALTEQAGRQSLSPDEDVKLRFDGIRPLEEDRVHSAIVPEFSQITADLVAHNLLLIRCFVVISQPLSLRASIIHKSVNGFITHSCDVDIMSLIGQLHIQCEEAEERVTAKVSFSVEPQLSLRCRLRTDETLSVHLVDESTLKMVVKRAICLATTTLPLSSLTTATQCRTEPASNQTLQNESASSLTEGQRLLIKVVKANGLQDSGGGCQLYCVLSVEDPPQSYITSPVTNSSNPFFDEQFIFDISSSSRKVRFRVYDRQKSSHNNFIGEAELSPLNESCVTEGRHTLPLTGTSDITYGSLNVEVSLVKADDVIQPSRTDCSLTRDSAAVTAAAAAAAHANYSHVTSDVQINKRRSSLKHAVRRRLLSDGR